MDMGFLGALGSIVISLILGLAAGFFMLEVKPSWVGGTMGVSALGLVVAAITAGLASRGTVRGGISGGLAGLLLMPFKALVSVLLAILKMGFQPLAWATLASLLTVIGTYPLAFAIAGAIVGGITGYLVSRINRWRTRRQVQYYYYYYVPVVPQSS